MNTVPVCSGVDYLPWAAFDTVNMKTAVAKQRQAVKPSVCLA